MDRRDYLARYGNDRGKFDARAKTLTFTVSSTDAEWPDSWTEDVEVPARFVVCPTCDGDGKHVNPAIDAHGISPDEFAEDPDFYEDYRGGLYDVACYDCHGERVVAVPDVSRCTFAQKRMLVRRRQNLRETEEFRRIEIAERMMGA